MISRTVNANDGTGPHTWNYSNIGGTTPTAVTVTDPDGNQTAHTFSTLPPGDSVSCSYYETGAQYFQDISGSQTLLKTISTNYSSSASPFDGGLTAIGVVPTQTTTTWANGKTSAVVRTYDSGVKLTSYSNVVPYGEVVDEKDYDYGNGAIGPLLRETSTTYLAFNNSAYLANNLLTLPSNITVLTPSGGIATETAYSYDQNSLVSSGVTIQRDSTSPDGNARSNLTSITRGAGSSTVATTTNIYYDAGMVQQTKDPNGNPTTFAYSSAFAGAYPTQITNALGHATQNNYDFDTGELISTTDPNNQTTSFTYDNMWRLAQVNYPDKGQTTITHQESSFPFSATSTQLATPSPSIVKTDVFDGLGRVTQGQLNSDPSGVDYTATTYDALGRVASVTNPYRSTSDPTYGVTIYTYDVLGRTTQITHPDGSKISTSYTGRATEVTDEGNGTKSVQRISQTDALGRLTSVCEVSSATQLGTTPTPAACAQDIGATGFLTSYAYDALGNLTGVAQGGLNSRAFAYDSLSRLTSATNPESGATSYTYDADGNVLSKKDARGITTSYAYDALNRLTQKSYSDGTTPSVNFTYDASSEWGVTLTNPIGRLALESTDNNHAMAIFSYDSMGRTANEWQCTPLNCGSGAFPLPYTYDLAGDDLTSSNGKEVTFTSTYNAAAQLTSMTSSLSDANHPGTLFSNAVYNAPGQVTSDRLGNGITETRAYNPRLWMTSLAAGSAYNLNMTSYAPNGDILAANDSANGNWTYTYDDFNRLASANATGQAYTYKYDRFGNRWQQNGPHTMTLTFSGLNNRMDGYAYDADGNVLNDGVHSYAYDAENRIISVDGGATTYVYDANGQRVRKTVGGASTDYVYDLAGHAISEVNASGVWSRGEVYAGGRHIATYVNDTTYFDHGDWLGTERVRTAVNGSVCESITSLPFGDGQSTTGSCADASTRHFTGKERDSESNLDYFGARYFSSSMGRFMSPDWASDPTAVPYASYANPQSLSLYNYMRNNPLNGTDPDGHCCDIWDAIDFVGGLLNSYGSDNLAGAGRQAQNTTAGQVGAAVGDAIATGQGAGEVLLGTGGEIGGVALDSTGVGALIGVPANVVSAGAIAHGAVTATEGATNLAKDVVNAPMQSGFSDKTKADARANAGGKCEYCGQETVPGQRSQKGVTPPGNEGQTDHYDPASRGGSNDPSNAAHACRTCNQEKSNTPPQGTKWEKKPDQQ